VLGLPDVRGWCYSWLTITAIAATVGMSRLHVYKWLQRFVQAGLEGCTINQDRGTDSGRCRLL
jgi:transposase